MLGIQFFIMFMMVIHLNYIHIIIHVRYSIFLCCTNFVYSLSLQVLTDGGRGSRALRGSFLGAWWEGCSHSTPAPPESAASQHADTTGGRFFFGRERSGEEE